MNTRSALICFDLCLLRGCFERVVMCVNSIPQPSPGDVPSRAGAVKIHVLTLRAGAAD